MKNIKVEWSDEDNCYLCKYKNDNLITHGDTKKEAIKEMKKLNKIIKDGGLIL